MTLIEDFNKIFEQAFTGNYHATPSLRGYNDAANANNMPCIQKSRGNTIQIDTIHDEENDKIKLVSEMPGVEKKDVRVVIDDNVISIYTVRGERKYHSRMRLGQILSGDVSAAYTNGILEIVLGINSRPQGREVMVD